MKSVAILAVVANLAIGSSVEARPVKYVYGAPDAPIAAGVVVPAGLDTFYVSGIPSTVAGGTYAQSQDVLKQLGAVLQAQGYGFADVVNAKVFLVAEPALGGKIDFAGMNRAFGEVLGTAGQPNKPSRVTVEVAGLPRPGAFVEIELTAVKAP